MLSAQAEGHQIETVEAMGEHPQQGWKATEGLHVIQQSFIDTGAIQCGYWTPAMVRTARALLARNPSPTEESSGRAFRGSLPLYGILKPVQAVLRAAAIQRVNPCCQLEPV